jgi:hypothetical protein
MQLLHAEGVVAKQHLFLFLGRFAAENTASLKKV